MTSGIGGGQSRSQASPESLTAALPTPHPSQAARLDSAPPEPEHNSLVEGENYTDSKGTAVRAQLGQATQVSGK